MIKIVLEIDVYNHQELAEEKKGKFASILGSLSDELEKKVEAEIADQVVSKLKASLDYELKKSGVDASTKVYKD